VIRAPGRSGSTTGVEGALKTDAWILVGADGGVTLENAGELAAAGADLVVCGSAVFARGAPARTIAAIGRSCDMQ
jgi:pentose-5-phosphate-3-epimerase